MTASATAAPPRHIPALDGLRALAILPVLVTHLWNYPASTPVINRLAAAGWAGVDLFFVLSGFLITRVLFAARERPDYYRSFYVRRVRRIAPAYYAMLAVVFIALPLVSHSAGLTQARQDWLWYVTYLSNLRLAETGWQVFLSTSRGAWRSRSSSISSGHLSFGNSRASV
jgi:peptidoglycan/LPS O-acetylase OafA/YrhL